jgi:hypothetical protein
MVVWGVADLEIPEADYFAETLERGKDLLAFGERSWWWGCADVDLGCESC